MTSSRRYYRIAAGVFILGTLLAAATPAVYAPSAAASKPAYTAAGLYNLANAYARSGKPGLAVLNYERARLLTPGDADLAANESHVRDALHLPTDPPGALQRATAVLLPNAVTPTAVAWLGVAGVGLLGAALLAARTSNRLRRLRAVAAGAGAVAVALTLCHAAILWPTLHSGVVIASSAPVLVSPVPMGEVLFTLPEAETVRLTAEHEGYWLIRTRSGKTGWISSANLVPVVPRQSP